MVVTELPTGDYGSGGEVVGAVGDRVREIESEGEGDVEAWKRKRRGVLSNGGKQSVE